MKITPVTGMPTIAGQPQHGLSPERLAAIKAIASSQTETQEKPEEVNLGAISLGDTPTSKTQSIKMNVNKTPEEILIAPKAQETVPPAPVGGTEVTTAPVALSDTNVQATKPETGTTLTVSPELAEIAKQRRALQIQERELAEKQKALEARPSVEALIEKLKSAPLSVLQEHGITYDQLTSEILGQTQSPSVDLQKIKEDILKTVDEKLSGNDSRQEENVYEYMRKEVDKMSNLEPYKFIKAANAQDKVMELVKRTWREQGEILTEEEAMNLIEGELREEARNYAKMIGELEPPKPPAEEPPVAAAKAPAAKSAPKTLTNKDAARPTMTRRQRAIAAALGQK